MMMGGATTDPGVMPEQKEEPEEPEEQKEKPEVSEEKAAAPGMLGQVYDQAKTSFNNFVGETAEVLAPSETPATPATPAPEEQVVEQPPAGTVDEKTLVDRLVGIIEGSQSNAALLEKVTAVDGKLNLLLERSQQHEDMSSPDMPETVAGDLGESLMGDEFSKPAEYKMSSAEDMSDAPEGDELPLTPPEGSSASPPEDQSGAPTPEEDQSGAPTPEDQRSAPPPERSGGKRTVGRRRRRQNRSRRYKYRYRYVY
jgi:hypothetical protein